MLKLLESALPYVWILIAIVLARKAQLMGKGFLVLGFVLMAVNRLGWDYFRSVAESERYDSIWPDLSPWVFFGSVACFVVGAIRVSGNAVGSNRLFGAIEAINRYFATDELVVRNSSLSPANEDIELLRQKCREFFQTIVNTAPDKTIIVDPGKYSRRLLIEHLESFGTYASTACGQLRSVEVAIAGPGDTQNWMTITVMFQAEHEAVCAEVIPNKDAISFKNSLSRHAVFRQIQRFLLTGVRRRSLFERIAENIAESLKLVLLPIHLGVLALGLVAFVVRQCANGLRGRVHTRFVASQQPELLPPESFNFPIGYWYVLLEGQGEKEQELKGDVVGKIKNRANEDTRVFDKEVPQWGGFRLKESRIQTLVEFRRCCVVVSIYPYGKDLYVRWESHINRLTWSLMRFPHSKCVGHRFASGPFSWSAPLFEECPSVFDFAPAASPVTGYDWADVDSIEALVHDAMTSAVRAFKEKHNLEKEIDFEIKKGQIQDRTEVREQTSAAGKMDRVKSWASGFRRQA